MSQARVPGLPRPVRLAFAIALGVYLAVTAWLVWRTAVLEPYADMFDWMARWYRFQANGDLGRYLWAPHNFHHMVLTFGVLGLDIRLFGGAGYLFLAVGVLSLAATGAMLAWTAGQAAGPGMRLLGAGVAAALSLMGCHVLDATADINTTYVHALVFAVAAILLAEGPGAKSKARGVAALGCALVAGLGSAAGLAVWPALLLGGWLGGRRGWMAAVLAAGVAFSIAYLLGQSTPAGARGLHAGASALLFLNYLSLPWGRGIPMVGWLVGIAMLFAALAAVTFKGGRGAPWPERAAVCLIVFSLVTGAMAGAARTGLIAPELVPVRYAVFLIPLHVGLWILAQPYLRRLSVRRPRAMAIAAVGAAGLLLAHQAMMALYAMHTADAALRAVADFRDGQRTPQMLSTIYPDLGKAAALSEHMRRDGLYRQELRPDPAPYRIGYFGLPD